MGFGGHRMSIIPEADLVLVHQADTGNNRNEYILSDGTLTELIFVVTTATVVI
jgi:hypothetical protein